MGNCVSHWQLLASDPERAAAFYTKLFSWTVDDANPLGYRRVSAGPGGAQGGIWPCPPEGRPFVQLFVEVDDVEATLKEALALGARVLMPPQVLPDGDTMALLLDTEGVSFGVFKPASRPG